MPVRADGLAAVLVSKPQCSLAREQAGFDKGVCVALCCVGRVERRSMLDALGDEIQSMNE